MIKLLYYYSKFVKKILRGKCVRNSLIDATAVVNSGSSVVNSTMGAYSYCSYDCNIINARIGKFCSLANEIIIGGDEHPIEWLSTSPVFQDVKHSGPAKKFARHTLPVAKETVIGNDVWIGDRAIVKQGVTVGDGAVIGAGAIVTKDVPPYAVVAGVPAKVLKYRFDEDIICDLMGIKWWDMDESLLRQYADKVMNVKQFTNQIKGHMGGVNNDYSLVYAHHFMAA